MNKFAALILGILMSGSTEADNAVNFHVVLSGANEVPPVDTPTTGSANLHVNRNFSRIDLKLDIRNAEDVLGVAGAHLHCAPANDNGPVVAFLAGAFTPGYDGHVQLRASLNDDSILNPACGANLAELVGAMLDGNVYINVHSTQVPSGVIRGQVE